MIMLEHENKDRISQIRQNLHKVISVSYPDNLPVSKEVHKIKQQVLSHQVIIVCGETGSGKTTQLPKILFELGFAETGIIGHTQPRKMAARSLAKRIGEELGQFDLVGYKVRFQDRTKSQTCIKLMTDGILLQEMQFDKYLHQYSALIIDEAHERSLNIDFILGCLKKILPRRPELKVIITSATIDNDKLSHFFNQAPIIDVKGKTFPVDIIYQPLDNLEDDNNGINQAIFKAVSACLDIERGNILIFLPGEREIKECIDFLCKSALKHYQILPLFSRQNESEQNQVFQESSSSIKIIVTTNVAETSLTIPGIRYVIDSGLARIKRYNSRYKVEQLLVEKISQASCKQRAGRAGRVSHGMCIRLFDENDFNSRPVFTDPEILRSNLANVILKLISLKLGNLEDFSFLDQPESKAFSDGFKLLYQLEAINESGIITSIGKHISQIPLDSNLAKMLISAGTKYHCLSEVLIIVSFLAIIDPREVPSQWQSQAREKHQLWSDKQSDFISIINLWQWYREELRHKKSNKQLLEKCRSQFVSLKRLWEWSDLHGQLKQIAINNLKYKENEAVASYQVLHQALLSGMLNNVGQKDLVESFYVGISGKKFLIHPSSTVSKARWICSAQLVQTTRLYARTNAYIESSWLVPLTKHLVKYSYANEHWDKKRGEVVAKQSVLFGGLLIDTQKVTFSKINSELAREIFIKEALIPGEFIVNYQYFNHNLNIIENLKKLEDKFRTAFIIVEDELFGFYNQRLPLDICDSRSFAVWYKNNGDQLKLNYREFMDKFKNSLDSMTLYPDSIKCGSEKVQLKYLFYPDNPNDGVTALINLTQLTNIATEVFEWMVPGIIRDKIAYVLRSLPKNIRIYLNPIAEFITSFLEHANTNNVFNDELVTYINKTKNLKLEIADITKIELTGYLTFHFQIIEDKKVLANGDDLSLLKKQFANKLDVLVQKVNQHNEINDIKGWIPKLNNLLTSVTIKQEHNNSNNITGYMSLVVKNNQVNLTVIGDINLAKTNSFKGILFLVKYHLSNQLKYLEKKQFNNFKNICLYLKDIYSSNDLLLDSMDFLVRMSVKFENLPKSETDFNELVEQSIQRFSLAVSNFSQSLNLVAKAYHEVKLTIKNHPLSEEIELQLDDLIYPRFLKYTIYTYLEHFPRYLQAIYNRLKKYSNNISRDFELSKEINSIYDAWYNYVDKLENNHQYVSQEIYNFKYRIEELRVSFFAQELKTLYPVSSKRLWRELESFPGFRN